MTIFAEAAKLEEQNRPFALAQIIDSRGSAPRHTAQMLIRDDGTIIGTIGGGVIERHVINEALEALREKTARVFHGRMARSGQNAVGADCGGAMTVHISVHGLRPRLVLVGAGHVNRAMAHTAVPLGFDIAVGDTYLQSLTSDAFLPSIRLVYGQTFVEVIDNLAIQPQDYVLIATHNQDREALELLIDQPVAWLGLLSSRRKVQSFLRQLRDAGVSDSALARLRAPVGYDIGAETPQEIAISILAEILQVKNRAAGGLLGLNMPAQQQSETPIAVS